MCEVRRNSNVYVKITYIQTIAIKLAIQMIAVNVLAIKKYLCAHTEDHIPCFKSRSVGSKCKCKIVIK